MKPVCCCGTSLSTCLRTCFVAWPLCAAGLGFTTELYGWSLSKHWTSFDHGTKPKCVLSCLWFCLMQTSFIQDANTEKIYQKHAAAAVEIQQLSCAAAVTTELAAASWSNQTPWTHHLLDSLLWNHQIKGPTWNVTWMLGCMEFLLLWDAKFPKFRKRKKARYRIFF